jgi:hypothetical protein
MRDRETNEDDPQAIALSALTWILGDDVRTARLLALTGLNAEDIRTRVGDPALLDAVLGFLEAHEPDLLACANTLGLAPLALVAARGRLQ